MYPDFREKTKRGMKKDTDIIKDLIAVVLAYIPRNVKPVAYLTETLRLSRESAYRRIRGEIPFTVEEISKLSSLLGFSVDNAIMDKSAKRASFDFIANDMDFSALVSMLQNSADMIENIVSSQTSEVTIALNHLPLVLLVFNDSLFRFTCYKWFHQQDKPLSKDNFSTFVVPEEVTVLQKRIRHRMTEIKQSLLILDPVTFSSQIKDIYYYYQRKLINQGELTQLREDMSDLINRFERIAGTGFSGPKTRVSLYLSTLYVNTNSCYIHFDEVVKSVFWIFMINPMIIYNREFCNVQKKWLNSLKRQSMLITQSNEILQLEFFDKQREYLSHNPIANF
jgi:hypothetical protein